MICWGGRGGGGVNAAKFWIMAVSVEVICYASKYKGIGIIHMMKGSYVIVQT